MLDERFEIQPIPVGVRFDHRPNSPPLNPPSSRRIDPRPLRNARRHTVKPTGDRPAISNPACVTQQDKKRRLKRILGVVGIAKRVLANPQNHRSMALDQQPEGQLGGLAIFGADPVNQLPVGKPTDDSNAPERSNGPAKTPFALFVVIGLLLYFPGISGVGRHPALHSASRAGRPIQLFGKNGRPQELRKNDRSSAATPIRLFLSIPAVTP